MKFFFSESEFVESSMLFKSELTEAVLFRFGIETKNLLEKEQPVKA